MRELYNVANFWFKWISHPPVMLTLRMPPTIYMDVCFHPNTRMMQAKVMNIHAGGLIGIGTVGAPVWMILFMVNVC